MATKKRFTLPRKNGLYLAKAGKKGRGVFCISNIRKGEIIEATPAVLLDEKATGHVDKTMLVNYTFVVGALSKSTRKQSGITNYAQSSSVIFGLMTFCNHDEKPNAEIVWAEDGGTPYYILHATRSIPKDTEICTTYGDGWFDDRK